MSPRVEKNVDIFNIFLSQYLDLLLNEFYLSEKIMPLYKLAMWKKKRKNRTNHNKKKYMLNINYIKTITKLIQDVEKKL